MIDQAIPSPHDRLFTEFERLCDRSLQAQAEGIAVLHDVDPQLASEVRALLVEDAEPTGHGSPMEAGIWHTAAQLLEPSRTSESVGRFILLERLGAGGMGVVYEAFDTKLERRVAVKLIRSAKTDKREQARLLREARAMAKVVHPNVITVFEADRLDEEVFIAMELVEGQTLRQWAAQRARTWQEVVSVYAGAAAGLAAAHEAGLVHRDFKPDNVLVGAAGRARVLDFGIARPIASPGGETRDSASQHFTEELSRGTADPNTTSMLGTPTYMAPEQFLGRATCPRTDQFAFCVALYEALYGSCPFKAESIAELFQNVLANDVQQAPQVPRVQRVPRWLRLTLLCGLQADPLARWPTMDDLLKRLRNGERDVRRKRYLAAPLGAAAVAAGWWAVGNAGPDALADQPVNASEALVGAAEHVDSAVPISVADRCVVGYEQPDFGGQWWAFCDDRPAPPHNLWDDAIASVKVPAGVKARLCTEPGSGGRCVNLSRSVPRLPTLDNDVSSVTTGRLNSSYFSILVAATPTHATEQLLVTLADEIGFDRFAGLVLQENLATLDSGLSPAVEFGVSVPMLPGWSDRGDAACWSGLCGVSLARHIQEARAPVAGSVAPFVKRRELMGRLQTWTGSLAYSWSLGEFRFVQLHNGIGTTRSAGGWNAQEAVWEQVQIVPSRDWLLGELADARAEQQTVIVFVADVSEELETLLGDTPEVAAIFSAGAGPNTVGHIPVFAHGPQADALAWRVDLANDRLVVYGVRDVDGHPALREERWLDIPHGFRATPNASMPRHNDKTIAARTAAECALACRDAEFDCRSFDYNQEDGTCHVSRTTSEKVPLRWSVPGWVYHERIDQPEDFSFYPNARVREPINRRSSQSTLQGCLDACRGTTDFACRSVNYHRHLAVCELSEATPEYAARFPSRTNDVFELVVKPLGTDGT